MRVEKGTREPTLDEAFGLAQVIGAAPANLLSPPEDALVALTRSAAVDGGGLRSWFATGFDISAWPTTDPLRVRLEKVVVAHAAALADASRVNDKSGIIAAVDAIILAVGQYQDALEAGRVAEGGDGRPLGRPRPERRCYEQDTRPVPRFVTQRLDPPGQDGSDPEFENRCG